MRRLLLDMLWGALGALVVGLLWVAYVDHTRVQFLMTLVQQAPAPPPAPSPPPEPKVKK
jgi:hypothetical protein